LRWICTRVRRGYHGRTHARISCRVQWWKCDRVHWWISCWIYRWICTRELGGFNWWEFIWIGGRIHVRIHCHPKKKFIYLQRGIYLISFCVYPFYQKMYHLWPGSVETLERLFENNYLWVKNLLLEELLHYLTKISTKKRYCETKANFCSSNVKQKQNFSAEKEEILALVSHSTFFFIEISVRLWSSSSKSRFFTYKQKSFFIVGQHFGNIFLRQQISTKNNKCEKLRVLIFGRSNKRF